MFHDNSGRPKTFFKTLRRLNCQNLDSAGLNDITDAFSTFMTRARYFSTSLRRTWSHSAIEFMRYRRRLPALVDRSSESEANLPGSSNTLPLPSKAKQSPSSNSSHSVIVAATDEQTAHLCKVFVNNISYRVTTMQLSAFFSKFGRVVSCSIPAEAGSLRRKSRGIGFITFKTPQEAERAKTASVDELTFYDRTMTVTQALPLKKRRTGSSNLPITNSIPDFEKIPQSPTASASEAGDTPEEEQKGRYILDLKDTELVAIFEMLSIVDRIHVERVCKRFLEQATNAWSKTRVLSFENMFAVSLGRTLHNQVLKSILHRCGRYVECLDLSHTPQLLDDFSLQIVSSYCPRLIHINLTGVKVHWRALKGFAENCVCLESITVHNSCSLNEKAFWWLFRHCNQLKCIDLAGCRKLFGRCFRLLGISLEAANLNDCNRIEPAGIEDLCRQCPNLTSLQLSGCNLLSDDSIGHICKLGNLQILNLGSILSRQLSSVGLSNLSKINSLRELSLANCKILSDDVLHSIAENCPQLSLLNLSAAGPRNSDLGAGILSSHGFELLCAIASNLRDVDFSYHAQLQDSHVQSLALHGRLRNLKCRGCTSLTDAVAQSLADNCVELWELDLSGCFKVTNTLVETFSKAYERMRTRKHSVTLVIGGTSCEPRLIKTVDRLLVLDTKDYSKHFLLASKEFCLDIQGSDSEASGEEGGEDDEFDALSLSRSFVLGGIEEDDDADEAEELPLD